MARSVFLLFAVCIISLGVLLLGAVIENQSLLNKVNENAVLIDSLQGECEIKDFTLGKYEFIIEQAKLEYPKQMKKIVDETE